MDGMPSKIGPYRIERQLGVGGMGSVYEARHEVTSLHVAIKVLLPEYARDPDMTTRFFNEARAVNKIEHPGILKIFDYGQQENGSAYIAMEFLKGETLSARLARGPAIHTLGESLRLCWQVATALAAAHSVGIIHRDIKPDNIMIVPDREAPGGEHTKLLDFGIAKLVENVRGDQPKTQSQVVMGTPQYMSPEQCKGARHVDDKTDVYALGTILFEMLTGRTPFLAESGGEYIGMHLFREVPRLRDLAPGMPAEVAVFVDTMLAKEKANRPAMSQVVSSLALYRRRYATSGLQSDTVVSRDAARTVRLAGLSTLGRSIGQLSRRALGTRWHLTGGMVVLLGIGSLAWYLHEHAQPKRVPPLTPATPTRPPSVALPPPAPAPRVHFSVRTIPTGATVIDGDGKILGRTPWEDSAPAAAGSRTLTLRLSGYGEQKITLDRSVSADRQEKLRPNKPAAPSKPRPPEKKIPDTIDYEQ